MREPFSFGAPERRRFAMQFGYDMRPSFWQEVRSNSHLVIAAVGTAALLGVAAVALWLALPANERQAVANPEQAIPAVPVKTTKIAPAGITVAAAAVPQAARKSDQVSPTVAVSEAAIPALAANDPRWTASQSKTAPAASGQSASKAGQTPDKPAAAAFAQPAADTDAATELAKVAAPAPAAGSSPDGAQTAAIPAAQPQVASQQSAAQDDDSKAEPRKAAAAGTGRILRAVTMRSGPKKNAAAIVTVPAKTSVQVMSCKRWCQIVYNGKTGWVYKTYIKTGA
ncbi:MULTISPECIES: SH3 domain-containing protein [unclassified Mesorhizobium]|uniref:SH3 domain-containing protein n=1 Tax=unclassified Mesorhizobium TaxID=325217 RepID=UPI001CCBD965|nr:MULTISPECIES: SH3 domain-containing protein [unclassified Mesorhizobium]MBZ9916194.1 SH3 domain-containing protein [Mesorhizobium sp. BR1-1-7]MBZ9956342.1 SH3 domain-containing protein [Mesorhizobium sp. BR1-1-15]MBZ9973453.1 SH3 domain-containing protein [Mesorhizobium sp. BR1-1-12]